MKLFKISFLLIALVSTAVTLGLPPMATAVAATEEAADEGHDELVLTSGKVIRGKLLEELDGTVRFLVRHGSIEAPVTYKRSDILEIRRGVDQPEKKASVEKTATTKTETKPERKARSGEKPKVYVLTLDGMFIGSGGLNQFPRRTVLSQTSLTKALDDALSYDPEVIIVRMEAAGPGSTAGVFVAEDIGPIFEQVIDDGHRLVFWIDQAVGGAGLLPFISPEIYFTSEGLMGGLGSIGELESGDHMVDEKLISATMGHAEGFAMKGGYDPKLIPAMCRIERWLAVRYRGGEPEYITWEPRPEVDGTDWEILTDDGQGKNEDEWSFEGNDVLNLDADLAKRLRVSKNTFDDLDDLVFALRIGRYYDVEYGRGEQILEAWGERIEDAIGKLNELNRELDESGRSRNERDINIRIRILKELRGLLTTYAEALDPEGSQRAQIDVQIDALRQSLRAARSRRR